MFYDIDFYKLSSSNKFIQRILIAEFFPNFSSL